MVRHPPETLPLDLPRAHLLPRRVLHQRRGRAHRRALLRHLPRRHGWLRGLPGERLVVGISRARYITGHAAHFDVQDGE